MVRLAGVAAVNPSKSEIRHVSDDTLVSFVPMETVDAESGNIAEKRVKRLGNVRKGYKYFRNGDVIFARITPCLENGKCAIANELKNGIGLGSTEFLVVRPGPTVTAEWIHHFLRQQTVRNQAQKHYTGTVGQQRVPAEFLEEQMIPLPPLEMQKQIVEKLDFLVGRILSTRKDLSRIPDLTRRLRMAILSKAFTGNVTNRIESDVPIDSVIEEVQRKDMVKELYAEAGKKWTSRGLRRIPKPEDRRPQLPEGWKYVQLGRWIYIAARIGWRGLKAQEYTGDGPLFLSVHNLSKGDVVDLSECKHISPERYHESPEIKLRNDDILLAKDGAGIGKIGIVKNLETPATVNSSLLVIRSGPLFHPEFLFYMLQGPDMQRIVSERITGSATPHLFQRDIRNFVLPVTSLQEQERVVAMVKPALKIVDGFTEEARTASMSLELLERSILDRTFRGQSF